MSSEHDTTTEQSATYDYVTRMQRMFQHSLYCTHPNAVHSRYNKLSLSLT